MADEKERVNWSALMDAHGIDPDADTASPAVEPTAAPQAGQPPARRSRLVHGVIAVTALFSIAASVAVLIALLRGGDERDDKASASAAGAGAAAVPGARPAAFQQTSDGVTVVPPEAAAPAAEPTRAPPLAATPEPPAERPAPAPREPERERKAKAAAGAKRSSGDKPAEPPADKAAPPPAVEKAAPPPPPPPPEPADGNLPDEPAKDAVASAMGTLEKDIAACAGPAKVSGEVGIKMRIEPDGRVAWASAKLENSPFQSCLDRLFKKARMPKSVKGATVRQTVQLP